MKKKDKRGKLEKKEESNFRKKKKRGQVGKKCKNTKKKVKKERGKHCGLLL